MQVSLEGKRILVTGATGGVGHALCLSLKAAGADVLAVYHSDADLAEKLQSEGVTPLQADLSSPESAQQLMTSVLASGPLDGFVYTAGNVRDGMFLKTTQADWDAVLALHLKGLVACTQVLVPAMKKAKQGKIIAMGSMSGIVGRMGQTNYAAAKAATIGFIKSLAKEVGRYGVAANVVCPGFVESKMTQQTPEAAWDRARADSAFGEISDAKVAASFMTWMLSDACHGVTGQIFNLDSRIY